MPTKRSLDDWYRTVNSIYIDRNFYRTTESLLCHLVEIVGCLSVEASGKAKPRITADRYLAKALGWWFALCGRVAVRSVDALVWAKFPGVCSYCHEPRHDDDECARRRAEQREPDWAALQKIATTTTYPRPKTVDGWQQMFGQIYPRSRDTSFAKNFMGLSEEVGELAEAVRVLPLSRGYFYSEAADVFAWIMGSANQLRSDRRQHGLKYSLEDQLAQEYPDGCGYCKASTCKCAPFPPETRDRIANEAPADWMEREGGGLFTLEESFDYFRVGDQFISIGTEQVKLTPQTTSELAQALGTLLARTDHLGKGLLVALARLQTLAERHEVTQVAVDQLLDGLKSAPSEERQVVADYLVHLGGGGILHAILSYFAH